MSVLDNCDESSNLEICHARLEVFKAFLVIRIWQKEAVFQGIKTRFLENNKEKVKTKMLEALKGHCHGYFAVFW